MLCGEGDPRSVAGWLVLLVILKVASCKFCYPEKPKARGGRCQVYQLTVTSGKGWQQLLARRFLTQVPLAPGNKLGRGWEERDPCQCFVLARAEGAAGQGRAPLALAHLHNRHMYRHGAPQALQKLVLAPA